jgi:DNA-binding IclR family transcriptional regulator
MQRTGDNNSAHLQAVFRTMKTLEVLARSSSGTTVLKLATTLGVGKSITSRLLASLLAQGYVVRESDTDRYYLSLKLTSIALQHAHRLGFPGVCQPILRRLSEETQELVQLSAVEKDHLVVVGSAQAKRGLSIASNLGMRVALHATASGKAWLASLNNEQATARALRDGLRALTSKTIGSVERLLAELEVARRRGYALAEGEFLDHVNAIAAPIGIARFGFAVGAIAVSAPASRLDHSRLVRLAPKMRAAASEISDVWPLNVTTLQDVPHARMSNRSRSPE